ncbi:MAG: 50S ribosomal protein L22 [Candidatus Staskawiczbacteria bacterium RIFCSPLOWO2_01_FULL_40_39]|uniref:Large ribosomal subunit protein uL22 n=1 Tax=Candidatus Staskawiczbacteria bacterium RIFCSPHIGHO2_01_FULL_39_25 TaxID=1802202 RepID=A0A1G2HQ91_9BACT|nr:MAG: 50S ribosomal protein L22 [Candidatus Staskawiczbacteria bacterium RIFCSPHIGHO2_01_FULL_39_25]OGZ72655.1 MAG: 50S ribosomal protein L22 [Candidatus Staskawiczbacteria bacterium RIFCSPLOWO2_01_FULL_40_39]OGZ76698.1 MAG: 50S ribosomal protein L22 [Candidatus Staskawiczbacteria bacterium RIFCSPLOWO2_02_FULL_39_8]
MEVKVSLNNLRTAPRKSREVVDLIRNKNVAQARSLLEFTVRRSAEPILKLLNSAAASAVHDFKLEESNLYISKVTVDEGPKLKRWHPMSRGRAYPIIKRTSHITLILSEKSEDGSFGRAENSRVSQARNPKSETAPTLKIVKKSKPNLKSKTKKIKKNK